VARDAAIEVREYRPTDRAQIMALAPRLLAGMPPWRERTHFTGQVDAYVGELVTATGHERSRRPCETRASDE